MGEIGIESAKWQVVYTRPRAEKQVVERLNSLGIENYCPMQTLVRQWSDRKKKVVVPVINSYLFVKIMKAQESQVLGVVGVVQFVKFNGKAALVSEEEISSLKQFVANGNVWQSEILSYGLNDKFVLNEGPFKNQKATIVAEENQYLSLKIESLGLLLKVKKTKHN